MENQANTQVESKIYRILIVDDNPKNLQVLGKLLQEMKYEIEFAINGKSALEWLESGQFDLLLLDINMPEMDGFEVCRKIRINPVYDNLPIIFLSANTDRDSILKGFEQGAQDYVTKPFDGRELIVRVGTHLSLKEARERLVKANRELEHKVEERTEHLKKANEKLNELNKELNLAKEKAETGDRLKTAFLNNISHEIRTPLNGILGFAAFLADPSTSQDEREMYQKILQSSSERLIATITDYIDMSLLVSGNIEVNLREIYMLRIFEAIDHRFRRLAEEKGLRLKLPEVDLAKPLFIKTDQELLLKILNHLLDNSIKFTQKGEIELAYTEESGSRELYIQDTGIGISQEALERVFEIFTQENPSNTRGHEGSGLGLSISSGMAKLIGAEIQIESEKGKGTRVRILFDPALKKTKSLESAAAGNKQTNRELKTILIAEDDDLNYLFFEHILKCRADKLIRAVTGKEAVEIYRTNPSIDLILMDIQMPEMNGYEATEQIRKFDQKVVIIAQTAYAMTGDKEKALRVGCNEHITKPVSKSQLFMLLETYFTNLTVKC